MPAQYHLICYPASNLVVCYFEAVQVEMYYHLVRCAMWIVPSTVAAVNLRLLVLPIDPSRDLCQKRSNVITTTSLNFDIKLKCHGPSL